MLTNISFNRATGGALTTKQLTFCKDVSPAISNPVVWVSPSGNDSNCGTQASPFATIAGATDHLSRIHWQGGAQVLIDGAVNLGQSPKFCVCPSAGGNSISLTIAGANPVTVTTTLALPTVPNGDWTPVAGTILMMTTYELSDQVTAQRGDHLIPEGLVWNQTSPTTLQVLSRRATPRAAGDTVTLSRNVDSITWSGTMSTGFIVNGEFFMRDLIMTQTGTGVTFSQGDAAQLNLNNINFSSSIGPLTSGFRLNATSCQLVNNSTNQNFSSQSIDSLISISSSRIVNYDFFINSKVEISGSYMTSSGISNVSYLLARGDVIEADIFVSGESSHSIGNRTTIVGSITVTSTSLSIDAEPDVGGSALEIINSTEHGLLILGGVVMAHDAPLIITDVANTSIRVEAGIFQATGTSPITITNSPDAVFGIDSRDGSIVRFPFSGSTITGVPAGTDDLAINGVGTAALPAAKAVVGPGADGAAIYVH